MHRTLRLTAWCALLLSATGCYTGTAAYVRPRAAIRSDPAQLLSVVQETVTAQGLRIVEVRRDSGLVMAVTTPVRTGDLSLREAWRISVRAGDVTVEMHPESALDGEAGWERDTRVCDCYHYAREREMLHAIRARLHARRVG